MEVDSLKRIERLNVGLGLGLFALGLLFTSVHVSVGIFFGAFLTCVNFSLIRKMVEKLLKTAPDARSAVVFLVLPKMFALIAATSAGLYFLKISAIGVAIGFSVFILSITIEAFRFWLLESDN